MMMKNAVTLLALSMLGGGAVTASDEILSIHGSGGSNPAKCYGAIMEELESRAKLPIRFTYRGTGSSKGLTEFKNDFNPKRPVLDFGSGEIPMKSEDWQTFQNDGVTVLHLPALFGAVSFYHQVPTNDLNLTPCLLARIFTRDITDWSHPDIVAINPDLNGMPSLPIKVARREGGSSSTKSVTQYLEKACPQYFPSSMVGSSPTWPSDTMECVSNSGMVDCIDDRVNGAGTIGYLDAGRGASLGLSEVKLENKSGKHLTSQDAAANGGIGAQESGLFPSSPDGDFGSVSVLDQDGEWTWPITLLTYLYVRLDLSFLDHEERTLLISFLKAVYDPNIAGRCHTHHGFTLASGSALELGQKAIDMLEAELDQPNPWTFEEKAEAVVGAGDYVLSANRRDYSSGQRDSLAHDVMVMMDEISKLKAEVAHLRSASATSKSGGGRKQLRA